MPTSPKRVKAVLIAAPDDRIGISLSWIANLETDLDAYLVYRGGAVVQTENNPAFYNVIDTDTLTLKIDGGKTQTVTFSNTYITSGVATPAEIVTNINAELVGGTAEVNLSGGSSSVIIRSDSKNKAASVQVIGGSSNAELQFSTEKFCANRKKTAFQLIETTTLLTYTDLVGDPEDFYYIQARTTPALLSVPSSVVSLGRVSDEVPNRVFIYGNVFDASGNPIKGAEVTLSPCQDIRPSLNYSAYDFLIPRSADHGIDFEPYSVLTDADGYFEVLAQSSTKLRLRILNISYDHSILTTTNSQKFTDLRILA